MQRSVGVTAVAPPVSAAFVAPPPPHRQPGGIRLLGQQPSLTAGSPTRVAPQGQESRTAASLSPPAEPRPQPPLLSKLLPRAFPPLTPAEDKVVSSATHVFLSESVPVGRRGSQQLPPKSPKSPRSPRPPKGAGAHTAAGAAAAAAAAAAAPYQPSVTSPLASPQHHQHHQLHQQQHHQHQQLLGPPASPTGGGHQLHHQQQQQQNQNQQQHTYAVPYAGQLQQQQQQHQLLLQQQQHRLGPRTRSHPNLVNDYVNVGDASPEKPPLPHQGGPPPHHPSMQHHYQHQQQQHEALHALRVQLDAVQARAGRVEALERELSRLADAHEALARSAERGARLEMAVRRRLERECALLRQENSQLRDQLARLAEPPPATTPQDVALLRRLMERKDGDVLRLEAENLALKEQLKSASQQHQSTGSMQS